MKESEMSDVLKRVEEALRLVEYGKVYIELRGPGRDVDVVTERRERVTIQKAVYPGKQVYRS